MIVHTVPELCQKGDFFLKKKDGRHFCLFFEFRLTLDKMENSITLMLKRSKSEDRACLKLLKRFIMCALYWISDVLAQ